MWILQVKKLQVEKRLDLLVDGALKSDYNSLELEEMVQVKILSLTPTQNAHSNQFLRLLGPDESSGIKIYIKSKKQRQY